MWADWSGDLVTHSGPEDEFKGKAFNLKLNLNHKHKRQKPAGLYWLYYQQDAS